MEARLYSAGGLAMMQYKFFHQTHFKVKSSGLLLATTSYGSGTLRREEKQGAEDDVRRAEAGGEEKGGGDEGEEAVLQMRLAEAAC